MLFFSLVPVFGLIISSAVAQNAITFPISGDSLTPGKTETIKWSPTTGGSVDLMLRSGTSAALSKGTIICTDNPNTGSFQWTVPNSLSAGSDYTIEIISTQNKNIWNYSPFFAIAAGSRAGAASSSGLTSSASMPTATAVSSSSAPFRFSNQTTTGGVTMTGTGMRTSTATRTQTTPAVPTNPSMFPQNAAPTVGTQGKLGLVAAIAGLVAIL